MGESLENLSREYDATTEQIQSWKMKEDADPNHWQGGNSETASKPRIEAAPTNQVSSTDPLANAQMLLGGASVGSGGPSSPPDLAGTGAPSSSTEKSILVTPDMITKIIIGTDKMVMSAIAASQSKGLPREIVLSSIEMPKDDLAMLETLAPYAAEYAPYVMQYAKPVLAGLFVGFWGLSMVNRSKALMIIARNYAESNSSNGYQTPSNN